MITNVFKVLNIVSIDKEVPYLPGRDLRMNRNPQVRIKQVEFFQTLDTVRIHQAASTVVVMYVNWLQQLIKTNHGN